jgi:hypothetical protein
VAGILALALIALGIVWWRKRHPPSPAAKG